MEDEEKKETARLDNKKNMINPLNIRDIQFEIEDSANFEKEEVKNNSPKINSIDEAINYFKDLLYNGEISEARYS
jgi:hypothetical protein